MSVSACWVNTFFRSSFAFSHLLCIFKSFLYLGPHLHFFCFGCGVIHTFIYYFVWSHHVTSLGQGKRAGFRCPTPARRAKGYDAADATNDVPRAQCPPCITDAWGAHLLLDWLLVVCLCVIWLHVAAGLVAWCSCWAGGGLGAQGLSRSLSASGMLVLVRLPRCGHSVAAYLHSTPFHSGTVTSTEVRGPGPRGVRSDNRSAAETDGNRFPFFH